MQLLLVLSSYIVSNVRRSALVGLIRERGSAIVGRIL